MRIGAAAKCTANGVRLAVQAESPHYKRPLALKRPLNWNPLSWNFQATSWQPKEIVTAVPQELLLKTPWPNGPELDLEI